MVPYAAPQYNCDGFAVTNVALKGTTQIRFTDKFALPVFAQAVWNPRMEDAAFSVWYYFKAMKSDIT